MVVPDPSGGMRKVLLLSVTQQGFIMKKNGVKIELFDNLKNMFGKKKTETAKP